MPAERTNVVTLGGATYLLKMENGVRQFHTGQRKDDQAGGAAQSERFYELIPFGNAGMGQSSPHRWGEQNHYSLDCNQEVWDQLGPGYDRSAISLGYGTVTRLVTIRDASLNRYLYVVNASATLAKIRLDTLAEIASPKVFAHAASPLLTDLIAVKDGAAPGIDARGVTQAGDGFLMAAFGPTASISQTNTIAVNATDTWVNTSGTAYGGLLYGALGQLNSERLIYKSTGVSGQNGGAFARVQALAATLTAGLDYSNSANWAISTPTPPHIGDFGSSITGFYEYQRGLAVAKPEGVYTIDQNYNGNLIFGMSNYVHDDNGKNMTGWGRGLYIPTHQDLMALDGGGSDGAVGISKLVSNESPIQGYPTAFCTYGQFAFVAIYDGTDTYILKVRARFKENVPHELVFFPITKLASAQCLALKVITRANGDTYLFGGNGSNLFYVVLDPPASRRYENNGEWYSTRFGQPGKRFTLDRIIAYGESLANNSEWTLSVSLDGGSYNAFSSWETSGRIVQNFTAGTNDTGTFARFKLVCTNTTTTNQPLLRGGGLYLEGQYRPEMTDRFRMVIHAGTWAAATGIGADAATVYTTIKGLIDDGPVNLVYLDFFGDSSNHKVIVEQVEYVEGPGQTAGSSERYIQVEGRLLSGS